MTLVARHQDFVQALRRAGIAVSLAEQLDAIEALGSLGWDDRDVVRAAYAATVVKRAAHRPTFETLFELYYPRVVGDGAAAAGVEGDAVATAAVDGPAAVDSLRERALDAMAATDGAEAAMRGAAAEAVLRLGRLPGRDPGQASWSSYSTLQRLGAHDWRSQVPSERLDAFIALVEGEVRRRIAEQRGPDHVATVAVRPSIDRVDFLSARREDLVELRRAVYPLARRLATRLTQEQHHGRRGRLDMRRTVRASLATGGVPLDTRHRARRPHRPDLVVLCDVSGSVAHFAQFTLTLVHALREQFSSVRAFTFVDACVEVTDVFGPGSDPATVMADLAASATQASRFGRTNYGAALTDFATRYADAVGPRSALLILGDARSNYSDLALPTLAGLADRAKHAWWLNPEHPRQWGTGDSAARPYGAIVPMVECRNLRQLEEFVHDLAR